MKVSETLELAKQKIIKEEDWFPGNQRANSSTANLFANRKILENLIPPQPSCNCALTAFEGIGENYTECLAVLRKAIKVTNPELIEPIFVASWNDSSTHEHVIKTYDVAIDLSKKEES